MPNRRLYWDANVFITIISNLETQEAVEDRINCQLFLRDAMNGESEILTSALTRVEVLHAEENSGRPIPQDIKDKIIALFDEPYITSILLDPARASEAQSLRWDYPWLQTADAIHIASAIYAKVDVMHTYDGRRHPNRRILSLNQMVGNPPLTISVPLYEGPLSMPL